MPGGFSMHPARPTTSSSSIRRSTEPVLGAACQGIEAGGWLKEGGYVYLESPAAAGEPSLPAGWTLLRSKRAGEVGYHLARRDALGALQQ